MEKILSISLTAYIKSKHGRIVSTMGLSMKKVVIVLMGTVFLVGCSQYGEPQGLGNDKGVRQKSASDASLEATFASIKTRIIDVKCLSCHKADSKSDAKDIPFETEEQVVNGSTDLGPLVVPGRPAESMLYKSIVSDDKIRGRAEIMPPKESSHAAVTASEQHVIAAWIAGVAVKTEPVVVSMPPVVQPPSPAAKDTLPDVVDFSLLKAEVLEKKCMTCHKEGGKSEDLAFSTREELLTVANSFGQLFVVAGKPEESILYISLLKDENLRQDIRLMPPKKDVVAGKAMDVVERDVVLIRKWILDGAK